MLFTIAVLFITALVLYWLFERVGLPGLLGMILAGILLGPQVWGFLDLETTGIGGELRLGALIVILIRAGLGIERDVLHQIGLSVVLMGSVPGVLEGATVGVLAWQVFGLSLPEAGMLGFILAAVSPAIIVPQMIELTEAGYGLARHVPTLVLASASFDDVFAITLFGVFAGLAMGGASVASRLLTIPVSIGIGLAAGMLVGRSMATEGCVDHSRRRAISSEAVLVTVRTDHPSLIGPESFERPPAVLVSLFRQLGG